MVTYWRSKILVKSPLQIFTHTVVSISLVPLHHVCLSVLSVHHVCMCVSCLCVSPSRMSVCVSVHHVCLSVCLSIMYVCLCVSPSYVSVYVSAHHMCLSVCQSIIGASPTLARQMGFTKIYCKNRKTYKPSIFGWHMRRITKVVY